MTEERFIPCYPLMRPRECPSGYPMHPINRANADICGLSRLMRDIGASEGMGGTPGWTEVSFTPDELAGYDFRVEFKPNTVPKAICEKCQLDISLRKVK